MYVLELPVCLVFWVCPLRSSCQCSKSFYLDTNSSDTNFSLTRTPQCSKSFYLESFILHANLVYAERERALSVTLSRSLTRRCHPEEALYLPTFSHLIDCQ